MFLVKVTTQDMKSPAVFFAGGYGEIIRCESRKRETVHGQVVLNLVADMTSLKERSSWSRTGSSLQHTKALDSVLASLEVCTW